MEQRALGRSGVAVSRVVLGCGNFGGIGSAPELFGQGESEAEAFALMDAASAAGITFSGREGDLRSAGNPTISPIS